MKRKVFLTGATGVMGGHGLRELMSRPGLYDVTVLARQSKKNVKKLTPLQKRGLDVIWGDLLDAESVAQGVRNADIVLHVGGMVSPAADWHPQRTIETNVGAMRLIIDAAERLNPDARIVYIGSVSQYGHYSVPNHWGECGDPLKPALFDAYAYSKTEAERLLAESGLSHWVSLRQTGILHSGLLMKASDPIAFHVPVRDVLEWVTAEDSGRLLERVCRPDVPESFWRQFYNIGGGKEFRMTNYEFESRLLKAMGCPPPEKVFDARWFATRNFHGCWYKDSDELEEILHFRSGITPDEYFRQMKRELPWYFGLAPLAPAIAIKVFMKHVAYTPELGPMWWISNDVKPRIDAAWGSREEWERLPGWEETDLSRPNDDSPVRIHKPSSTYRADGILNAVKAREGRWLNPPDTPDTRLDLDERLSLRCREGHEFTLRVRTLIEGGHWCPECMKKRSMC